MSYAAPISLLSFHLPDRDDWAEARLTWPLAGSLAIHVVVLMTFLGLRFASSLEQSSGSYEVTLVTLPEISASPAASPEKKSRPDRNAGKVPPPKAEAGEVPKAAPQKKEISPPAPVPREKPRVPERVTDSLVGALESVVVPKPQALALPQKAAPVPLPPLPLLPVSADPEPAPKQDAEKPPPPPLADDGEAPKPERVTDSLMGALDSVVVPKPQVPVVPQKAEPVPAPALPPAPVKQAPAVDLDVQPVQAPPQPPKLAPGPATGKPETPAPAPKVGPLADKLKQAVGAIVVPKQPKQTSGRVTVTPDGKRKQDINKKDTPGTPRSSGITLPSRAPRLAAVAPPSQEAPKKETPRQTARKNSTVESLTQAIQSVRIPGSIPKSETPQSVPGADPLVPEPSPKHSKASEVRNLPQKKFVPPQAPVEQPPVVLQPAVPKTPPEPDTLENQIDKLAIPEVPALQAPKPVSKQTESGAKETLALKVAGSSPKENIYWGRVRGKIDKRWIFYRSKFDRSQPLQVVLAFRVERNGQVTEPTVVRSSGNTSFDLAAKHAIEAAIPLPRFPENMTQTFYDVEYTFTSHPNQ